MNEVLDEVNSDEGLCTSPQILILKDSFSGLFWEWCTAVTFVHIMSIDGVRLLVCFRAGI